ncbi:hypothetical protein H1R20_g6174, partial [Candolleomyces eurysporus]
MITLYDFAVNAPNKSISPFTWRVRLALNIKGIKHQTEWLDFPKIEEQSKKLGIPPSEIKPDGKPFYSIPAIYDPSTNTRISDSLKIIEYLDKTYPDKPQIIAPGTSILNASFSWAFGKSVFTLFPLVAPHMIANSTPEASSIFRARFEGRVKMTLEEFENDKALPAKLWAEAEEAFTTASAWFKTPDGQERLQPWIMGREITFADLIVWGALAWAVYGTGGEDEATMSESSSTATLIDFASTSLAANYTSFYAKIVDDVFTEEECTELIKLASTAPHEWKPAGLSTTGPTQTVHTDFRNSDRALVFDDRVAAKIYERLRPLVPEIHEISPTGEWSLITGKAGRKQGPTWKLVSFLRYGPGHYFKPHCDGLVELEEENQKAFVTLHMYLNDRDENGVKLEGGSTRFWTPNKKHFLDVEPKIGRVLVFQQRMLVHSGEEVLAGMKYTMRSDFMFEQTP